MIPGLKGLFDPDRSDLAFRERVWSGPSEVRAGVAAVVLDGAGRVLLMRRTDNGMWGIPSGHVEPGETIDRAATREVWEETGLVVLPTRLVGVYSDPASQVITYPDGRICHFITTSFTCEVTGGQLHPDGVEALDAAFFRIDELPSPLTGLPS